MKPRMLDALKSPQICIYQETYFLRNKTKYVDIFSNHCENKSKPTFIVNDVLKEGVDCTFPNVSRIL